MPEEFVRKEVYEADLRRMDQRFDSLEKRMDERFEGLQTSMREGFALMNERMDKNMTEIKGEIRALDTRIDAVNMRIDSVQTTVYWGFALMGLILAFTTFAPALLEFVKGLRKPTVIMDEVERMINTAIAQARLEGK